MCIVRSCGPGNPAPRIQSSQSTVSHLFDLRTRRRATDPTFIITGAPATVSGSSQGAFVGDGSEALGIVNGTNAIGAKSAQGFTGVYKADQQWACRDRRRGSAPILIDTPWGQH